jgi:hypothetical protein
MQGEKILIQTMMMACTHYSEVFSVEIITAILTEKGLKLSHHKWQPKFKHRTNLSNRDLSRAKLHKI